MVSIDIDFHCNACGKCCNSPPLMTMEELFRHADRFVGALSLRRVRPPRVGTRHGTTGRFIEVTKEDVAAFDALAQRQGYPLPDGDVLMIATQAIDYPSRQRCPALSDDGRCSVHASRPTTCAMVPLDAWVPDRLQAVTLEQKRRGGVQDIGADCVSIEVQPGYQPLVRAERIVDAGYAAALTLRRDGEAQEKQQWGEAVWKLLKRELLGRPHGLDAVPFDHYRTLPLTLVLDALLEHGHRSREECLTFIATQRLLISTYITAALTRRQAEEKPMTAQLRQFELALAASARRILHPIAGLPT